MSENQSAKLGTLVSHTGQAVVAPTPNLSSHTRAIELGQWWCTPLIAALERNIRQDETDSLSFQSKGFLEVRAL